MFVFLRFKEFLPKIGDTLIHNTCLDYKSKMTGDQFCIQSVGTQKRQMGNYREFFFAYVCDSKLAIEILNSEISSKFSMDTKKKFLACVE